MDIGETDARWLRRSFDVARRAGENGNGPFGAVLVDDGGNVLLEDENTATTTGDVTGHAEINLVRRLSELPPDIDLSRCTLYASTEPCAMCAASIHYGGIGRVVFGLSSRRIREAAIAQGVARTPGLSLHSHEVFARSERAVAVIGPALEDEALAVQEEFWS